MAFVSLTRDYEREAKLSTLSRSTCNDHPLLNEQERKVVQIQEDNQDNESKNNVHSPEKAAAPERAGMTLIDPLSDPLADPLSMGTMLGGGDFDPLGAMGAPPAPTAAPPKSTPASASTSSSSTTTATTATTTTKALPGGASSFQMRWNEFKNDVLLHYNVSGKFRVKANFMTDIDESEVVSGKKLPTDSAKKRLEKLQTECSVKRTLSSPRVKTKAKTRTF